MHPRFTPSRRRSVVLESVEPRKLLSTYYVATTGNDGNPGTQAAPWLTLQHAADKVVAGDTVNVGAGNFRGFDIRHGGTSTSRITFKGAANFGTNINSNNTVTGKDGINIEDASYITIDGFKLTGTGNPSTSRTGIRIVGDGFNNANAFSHNVIIQNNNIDNWGVWGILTGFTDDIVIQNNTCSHAAQQHGIYFSNSGDRPIIRNNICFGNADCGIQLNADIHTGNTSLPGVDGITTGAVIEGNKVYSNGGGSAYSAGGGAAINCDGVQNSTIDNNLLYDNHAGGLVLYQFDGGGPSSGNLVVNNTMINAANSRYVVSISNNSTKNTLFNNILFNLNTSGSRGSISLTADSKSGFLSDENFIDPRFDFGGQMTLAQWQAATGSDTHSHSLTQAQMQALFTNYAGNDYTLAAGSAAVDAGVASLTNAGVVKNAPTKDLLGTPRPQGAKFDVGCYERKVASSALPAPWKDADIGTVGIKGSATYSNGTFTVKGGGANIAGTSDAFNYVNQFKSGNFTLTAKVNTLDNTNAWAKAGVMARASNAANAAFVAVVVTPSNGVNLLWRSSTGATVASTQVTGIKVPVWVRLVESSGQAKGYYSTNGTSWIQIGTAHALSLTTASTIGLCVTARDNTKIATATFSNVTVV